MSTHSIYRDVFLFEREGGQAQRAARLAFGDTSGRDEAWLRDTLLTNPDLIPVADIDASFGPLIPLCRELRTEAGPLDLAFINPAGRLTLVECKLWRNPESRRKVVAQVLDYARAISAWSYSDLQRQVAAATGRQGNVPYQLARSVAPDLEEHRFVDDVSRAMRRGRFLLLIAGDGIREDVGALAELINRNAASGFSFGMLEIALYGLGDDGLLIQPRVVARTQIIERSVVLVREGSETWLAPDAGDSAGPVRAAPSRSASPSNGAPSAADGAESSEQAAYRAWWAPVMARQFDDPDQEPLRLFWRNNVRTPLPWPGTWILAYGSKAAGTVAVCLSGRQDAFEDLMQALAPFQDQILSELPEGTTLVSGADATYNFRCSRSIEQLGEEDAQRAFLGDAINRFVNVFRPRVKALVGASAR